MPVQKASVSERVSHINNESREQLFNLQTRVLDTQN